MSFTDLIPAEVFAAQRQFMRIMDSQRDFAWWAETLVTKETAELKKAHDEKEGIEQILKEMGDVIYVVAGFYNCMPAAPVELLSDERNQKIDEIITDAWNTLVTISNDHMISPEIIGEAFAAVHLSNLSKLDPETGEPIRREDGKILKGPFYQPADMTKVVKQWKAFIETQNQGPTEDAENSD